MIYEKELNFSEIRKAKIEVEHPAYLDLWVYDAVVGGRTILVMQKKDLEQFIKSLNEAKELLES